MTMVIGLVGAINTGSITNVHKVPVKEGEGALVERTQLETDELGRLNRILKIHNKALRHDNLYQEERLERTQAAVERARVEARAHEEAAEQAKIELQHYLKQLNQARNTHGQSLEMLGTGDPVQITTAHAVPFVLAIPVVPQFTGPSTAHAISSGDGYYRDIQHLPTSAGPGDEEQEGDAGAPHAAARARRRRRGLNRPHGNYLPRNQDPRVLEPAIIVPCGSEPSRDRTDTN